MKEKIEIFINRNKIPLCIIVIIIGVIHQIIGFFKTIEYKELIVFFFINILLAFIIYEFIILQYNFQKKYNPIVKISILNKINDFEIIIGIIFLVFAIVNDSIISLFQSRENYVPIAISPLALAICLSSIRIKYKNQADTNNYYKVKNPRKVVSIFIMIFGTGWFLSSGIIYAKNKIFILNSIETTGTIIRYEEHKNSENGFTYSTKYSYIDKNNKEHIKTGTSASYPPEYEIGAKIKVFYNSKDFDKSIYESKTVKIICLIFGIGGFIIFSIGFIIFICAGMEK